MTSKDRETEIVEGWLKMAAKAYALDMISEMLAADNDSSAATRLAKIKAIITAVSVEHPEVSTYAH